MMSSDFYLKYFKKIFFNLVFLLSLTSCEYNWEARCEKDFPPFASKVNESIRDLADLSVTEFTKDRADDLGETAEQWLEKLRTIWKYASELPEEQATTNALLKVSHSIVDLIGYSQNVDLKGSRRALDEIQNRFEFTRRISCPSDSKSLRH